MQLMPKALIGSIGGAYLKNSKSVFFLPQHCEALENLVQVMSTGYVSTLFLNSFTIPYSRIVTTGIICIFTCYLISGWLCALYKHQLQYCM